ncbi:hypothetical protein [Massilia sp. TWR1-2-2]|uniref:hypothetical protein n=1 Tax=Massilia sp. TWR1-2-2 TaxID=2804584 RepID=UPI003CECE009
MAVSRTILTAAAMVLWWAAHVACAAAPPVAPVADARAEYRAVFCAVMQRDDPGADCSDRLRRFPDEAAAVVDTPPIGSAPAVNVVMVGGLFGECLPSVPTFGDAATRLRAVGYRVSHAPVLGRASAEANAAIIRAHVAGERAAMPDLQLVIVAYSKGVADTMTALAAYPDMADNVGAFISVAGVVKGSHAADRMVRLYDATAARLPVGRCAQSDGGAVRTLTREYRANWLATHRLPAKPLYFSIVGLPTPARMSSVFSVFQRRLAPIDRRNDGQMIYSDAVLPRGALLAYANADHFAIALALPTARLLGVNRNDFPRAQMVEAAVRVAQARLISSDSSTAFSRSPMLPPASSHTP